MSTQTTADCKRDEAKEYISKAYRCILEAVDDDTWGSQDYRPIYVEILEKTLVDLRRIKREL